MTSKPLTLSESGLALILLENEIERNRSEVRRMQDRFNEARSNLIEAKERLEHNESTLSRVTEAIGKNNWTYGNG